MGSSINHVDEFLDISDPSTSPLPWLPTWFQPSSLPRKPCGDWCSRNCNFFQRILEYFLSYVRRQYSKFTQHYYIQCCTIHKQFCQRGPASNKPSFPLSMWTSMIFRGPPLLLCLHGLWMTSMHGALISFPRFKNMLEHRLKKGKNDSSAIFVKHDEFNR